MSILRRLLLAYAILAVATSLHASECRRPLVIGVGIGFAPYEYLDAEGQPAGYVIDVLRAVAAQQGLNITLRPMPFGKQAAALESGEVDALAGMALTPSREKHYDTCIAHSLIAYGIVVRTGHDTIRSQRDLHGKVVLGLEGGIASDRESMEAVKPVGFVTHEAALMALDAGQGDCAVVPRQTLQSYQRSGQVQGLSMVPLEFFALRRSFAVRRGNTALLEALNQGLYHIQASGELTRIHDRHLGPLELPELSLSQGFRRVQQPFLLAAGALSGLGVLAWIHTLRRTVRRRTAALEQEIAQRREAEAAKAGLLGEQDARNAILQSTVEELCRALAEVEQLSGLIPICAECKSVRDDKGYWTAVEAYVTSHSGAKFTHGLCPCCVERHREVMEQTRA